VNIRAAVAVLAVVAAACDGGSIVVERGSPDEEFVPPKQPPNILIIVTDDQRAKQTLSVMPATRKWFVRGGTRFPNAVANTALCCPSRASILTGQFVHNHGVRKNQDGDLLRHDDTMERYLSDAGYRTGLIGKFLQGIPPDFDPPNFTKWATYQWGYYDRPFNVNGRLRVRRGYATDRIGGFARRFLRGFERHDDQPWFLYVATTAPHLPFQPAPEFADAKVPRLSVPQRAYERARSDKLPRLRRRDYSLEDGDGVFTRMERTLLSVDKTVGRVFRILGELEERRDTLAIFVSDNGHLLGEHGLYGKRLPYSPDVEVPLLMRWPSYVARGAVDRRLVATVDIAPTVLHAAGVDVGGPAVDGASLLESGRIHDVMLIEQFENHRKRLPDWSSLRTTRYQYIEYYARDGVSVIWREYYDLRRDPLQLRNLLGDDRPGNDPDVDELSARLAEARSCAGETCP
jgi:arylsulfatase A-like enzyme